MATKPLLAPWVGSPVSSLLGLCSGVVYWGMHGIAVGIAVAVESAVGVFLEEMLERWGGSGLGSHWGSY